MSERLVRSLGEAVLTLLAMLGTVACTALFEPGAAAAILGAVLSLSLARSHLIGRRHGTGAALIALPLVALASVAVGALLRSAPWAGAAVFTGGMALSIWGRRYGVRGRHIGSMVALPLVTILVVPGLPRHGSSELLSLLTPVALALVALAWVTGAQKLGQRLRWLAPVEFVHVEPQRVATTGSLRLSPHTRMALQMAAALGASFVVGYVVFPAHWNWIVLTAFIVNSGNRGRQDVVHKSVQRVMGAAAGTVAAMVLVDHSALGGPWAATLIFVSVFLGIWLRPLAYGWWALFATMALALLQSLQPAATQPLLSQRLIEIVIGAAIGLASAWFVLPIRSTDVLRRRIADALAAMAEAVDPQVTERRLDDVVSAMRHVELLRPSFQARKRLLRHWQPLQPVDWIDVLSACEAPLVSLIERGETPAVVRKAIGTARKAMREPEQIMQALSALRQSLEPA